jgi:hypothetical protein
MFGTPASLVGMVGTAFLVASFAPTMRDHVSPAASREVIPAAATKADRLSFPRAANERATVAVIELVGISQATVILRNRDGRLLYRSDPLTNTTLVAKDAELPVVTLKEGAASPVVQRSASPPQASPPQESEQPNGKELKVVPLGCEGTVSSLVGEGGRLPGRCLAELSGFRRS